ncbi:hypothetical protein [Hydrogenophaga taeniospiralis]|uniref:hypothetical protein n=1 Tax=Hydrogenophaga taeniospiralis TaxID=65656 RepID=UPI001CF94F24|nr:hypothetical protein [Hydrogenophaga taeniospiralis]
MSKWIPTLVGVMVTGWVFAASAQTDAEHTQHHPAAASATSPATASIQQVAPQAGMSMGMSMPQMQQHMQQHMATMQTLHAKMAAAPTAAERQALMADHSKAMHEGMDMMKGMKAMGGKPGMGSGTAPADPAQHQPMMEMRMDMMQTMMDMMMQRMPASATPPASK